MGQASEEVPRRTDTMYYREKKGTAAVYRERRHSTYKQDAAVKKRVPGRCLELSALLAVVPGSSVTIGGHAMGPWEHGPNGGPLVVVLMSPDDLVGLSPPPPFRLCRISSLASSTKEDG